MTTQPLVKVPMVSTVVMDSPTKPDSVNISYYVGDTIIMTAEIQRDILLDEHGVLDQMTLTQLMVTPHEHLDCLDHVLSAHGRGEVSGEDWEALMLRITSLLRPPQPNA